MAALQTQLDDGLHRWVHSEGELTLDVLDTLHEIYGLDELVLEDLLHRERRPKLSHFGAEYLLVLLVPVGDRFTQLAVYATERVVFSFCERPIPGLEQLYERLQRPGNLIRERGVSFLAYALLDLTVDCYFERLEQAGDVLEELESDLDQNPTRDALRDTHDLRAAMMLTRKYAWATRNIVAQFQRYNVDADLMPYLQDCQDHIVAVVDLSETYREMATAVIEVHLSVASHHLNETIRVLTIISVLFIPATFIVGVYGMNFDRSFPLNMPELGWPYGYLAIMSMMALSMIAMIAYFKRKKWF